MHNVLIFDSAIHCGAELARRLSCFKEITIAQSTGSADEALGIIKKGFIDVLVAQADSHNQDGLQLLSEVKRDAAFAGIRAIVVFGVANDGLIAQALKLGASYCMIKPINVRQLYERVMMILRDTPPTFDAKRLYAKSSREIYRVLDEFDIKASATGCQYLHAALEMSLERQTAGKMMLTKELYPAVARRFGVNNCSVERCIRASIGSAWSKRGETASKMAGFNSKPSNGQFIATLYRLLVEYREKARITDE